MSSDEATRKEPWSWIAPSFNGGSAYQGMWYPTEREAREAASEAYTMRAELVARAIIIRAVFRADGVNDFRTFGTVVDA